jgi:hypothetical membrane protein
MANQPVPVRQWPFVLTMFGCVQFVVLTVVAMFFYGGGTVADPAAGGYHFFQNFFSDLGLTEARSGAPNTVSAALFFVALTLAGLGLVLFFAAMPRFFRQSRLARVLSGLGTVAGVIAGLSFVGVAFTPANLYLGLHALLVQSAFLAFFIAAMFYLVTILVTREFPNRYAAVLAAFALLLALYLWLLFSGPSFSSPEGLTIQATGQKIIVYAAIIAVLILANGARRLIQAQATRRRPPAW